MAAEEDITDPAGRLDGVCARGKGEGWAGIRARELHLRQVVDEEVELGGHAAQAGLDQPATRPRVSMEALGREAAGGHASLLGVTNPHPIPGEVGGGISIGVLRP